MKKELQAMNEFGVYVERYLLEALPTMWVKRPKGAEVQYVVD